MRWTTALPPPRPEAPGRPLAPRIEDIRHNCPLPRPGRSSRASRPTKSPGPGAGAYCRRQPQRNQSQQRCPPAPDGSPAPRACPPEPGFLAADSVAGASAPGLDFFMEQRLQSGFLRFYHDSTGAFCREKGGRSRKENLSDAVWTDPDGSAIIKDHGLDAMSAASRC